MTFSTLALQLLFLSTIVNVSISYTTSPLTTSCKQRVSDATKFRSTISSTTDVGDETDLSIQKKKLFDLLRVNPVKDPVLADPVTKEDILITANGAILAGGSSAGKARYRLESTTNTYVGSSDSYIDLLEPVKKEGDTTDDSVVSSITTAVFRGITPFLPPPVRTALANADLPFVSEYLPMRDLFTSPTVSFAYERGWRQGFNRAGFPGPEQEAQMAMDYFEPSMAKYYDTRVLVDMSCATGLFTRRFTKSGKYKRVLGCDYSASMLNQARLYIENDKDLSNQKTTQLDLVRLDVGRIPMKDASVDSLHAGAAMHCWPDLPGGLSEIHRVLKPGGRYFATTFLLSYFSFVKAGDDIANSEPNMKVFNYFEDAEQLKQLVMGAGFDEDKVFIEVLGNACVVIRCEK